MASDDDPHGQDAVIRDTENLYLEPHVVAAAHAPYPLECAPLKITHDQAAVTRRARVHAPYGVIRIARIHRYLSARRTRARSPRAAHGRRTSATTGCHRGRWRSPGVPHHI